MEKLKNFTFEKIPSRYIQLTGLAIIGILELFAMLFSYNTCNEYMRIFVHAINLIAILYLGMAIRTSLNRTARNLLLLGLLFCAWPILMQIRDFKFLFNPAHPNGRLTYNTLLCEYLMLLSFAAVADEKDKSTGLKVFGWFYVLAGLCFSVLVILLQMGLISPELKNVLISKDVDRLFLIWHPNITARIMMLAVGVNLIFICMTRKIWLRVALTVLTIMDYVCMSLTDSRSVMLIASGLAGGVIFFLAYKRTWKTFLLGFLAAAISSAIIFAGMTGIFKLRFETFNDINLSQASQLVENAQKETVPAVTVPASAEAAEASAEIPGNSQPAAETAPTEPTISKQELLHTENLLNNYAYRYSSSHFFSFGGRTSIWEGVLRGLAENPIYLLTGVRDSEEFVQTYSPVPAPHSHNAWLQILLELGVIGLAFAIYITYLAVRSCFSLLFFRKSSLYQKAVCILILGIMATEFFEPFIFFVVYPKNFINMLFLLCLGYAVYWYRTAEPLKAPKQ